MLPKIIMHNSISIDGSLKGFEPNFGIHYRTAAKLSADAYLVGSQTILNASVDIPPETEKDFEKPIYDETDKRPYWIVVDSKGKLQSVLHFFRRVEFIKDIIMLISKDTPKEYVDFLKQRKYEIIVAGNEFVDYKSAFEILLEKYNIKLLLTDTGSNLTNVLLKQGLINELSLLIAPYLLEDSGSQIFRNLELLDNKPIKLHLISAEKIEKDYVWLRYAVEL